MAEEAPKLKNKGLLLVSVILGVVVVIIYNVHINRVRASLEGKQVLLLKFAREMTAGEKVDRKDLRSESIRKDDAAHLGSVVQEDAIKFLVGRRLRQSVSREEWVQWNHVTGNIESLSSGIKDGMVAITQTLDRSRSPGPLCSPGDRVNIMARVQVSPDPAVPTKVVRMIRNVEVVATGSSSLIGQASDEMSPSTGSRSYRTIGLEVTPEVSKQFSILQGFIKGEIWLEVLPTNVVFDPKKDGIINPEEPILQDLLKRAGATP